VKTVPFQLSGKVEVLASGSQIHAETIFYHQMNHDKHAHVIWFTLITVFGKHRRRHFHRHELLYPINLECLLGEREYRRTNAMARIIWLKLNYFRIVVDICIQVIFASKAVNASKVYNAPWGYTHYTDTVYWYRQLSGALLMNAIYTKFWIEKPLLC
jgi:hypothetical protein